jgi:TetR/AcrR family transcriptional repressor of nem operon
MLGGPARGWYFLAIDRSPGTVRAPRRVGAETSATRHALLDAVERLMLEQGYAAVTYRTLANRAGVTPALVQYYFPTLDSLLLATVRRRIEGHVERLAAAFAERPNEPLHVIWEFSTEEATAALLVEFTAMGNHRKSIQDEIAKVAEKVRQVQIDAIGDISEFPPQPGGELSKPALVFLLAGIPKLLSLEARLGVTAEHGEILAAFEGWLDAVEPRRSGGESKRRR